MNQLGESFLQRLFGSAPLDEMDRRKLRLWPSLLIAAAVLFCVFGMKYVAPGSTAHMLGMMMGPMVAAGVLGVWLTLFSRMPWLDRALAVVVITIAFFVTYFLAHETIAPPDMPPIGLLVFGVPSFCTTVAVWLYATRSWTWNRRRLSTAVIMLLACLFWTLVRCDGLDGLFNADMAWRWSPTPEQISMQKLQAISAPSLPASVAAESEAESAPLELAPGDWPCFRNTDQNNKVTGITVSTDWNTNPPKELWRHPIGLGWSSYSVVGEYLFTQEQRGDNEAIVAYRATDGTPIWQYTYEARFYETVAGAGPRATPTFHEGRVYSTGATGVISCLDAKTGTEIWTRNLVDDVDAKVPEWGFSSSPLIVNGLAVVYGDNAGLVAYDIETGDMKWQGEAGERSYSSAQLTSIGGEQQILILTGDALTSVSPQDGSFLWEHEWPAPGMARVIQPCVLPIDDTSSMIFLGTGYGIGTRSIVVTKFDDEWDIEEAWTSRHLKPYFNDMVLHDKHLYGFDGVMLTCLDTMKGKRKWKMRGYGHGQVLLLKDQELLLIISETGELALVEAKPDGAKELAKMPALTGKTWNHPVIAHGKLFVRNGEEAACYDLTK